MKTLTKQNVIKRLWLWTTQDGLGTGIQPYVPRTNTTDFSHPLVSIKHHHAMGVAPQRSHERRRPRTHLSALNAVFRDDLNGVPGRVVWLTRIVGDKLWSSRVRANFSYTSGAKCLIDDESSRSALFGRVDSANQEQDGLRGLGFADKTNSMLNKEKSVVKAEYSRA